MTQKELLYVEDAVEHEKAIIDICYDSINKLSNSDLKDFFEEQITVHERMKEELLSLLKEIINE